MRIRPATLADIPAILIAQQENPQAAQWQGSDYARMAGDPSGVLVVAEGAQGQILGFAAARRVTDEAELQNLAVHPEHQRHGIGQALLDGVHGQLRAAGTKRVVLEVRPSNQSALAFYRSSGYTIVGRREDYYAAPPEHALVLSTVLDSKRR